MIRFFCAALAIGLLTATQSRAVPTMLNHQGRMAVNGVNFDGPGQFKFALVDETGSVTYWSNDGTSTAGAAPTAAVPLTLSKGLYAMLLGDATLPNMQALPGEALEHADVRLRVWFNDGANGFEQITPDQRLAAVPYAIHAASVEQVLLSRVVAPPQKPVVAWGRNSVGQTNTPKLSGVAAVAAGGTQSMALLKNGTVVLWGKGYSVPAAATGIKAIAAGVRHFLACKADGTVLGWGDNQYGQAPTSPSVTGVVQVAAGEKHSVVLLGTGTVAAWGDNSFGQTSIPPTAVNVTAIASGYDHILALTTAGTVVAWGRNDSGQAEVPAGLVNVVAIAAGAHHSLALKSDGMVIAWGWNNGGQSAVPLGLGEVTQVAGGYAYSMALKKDGSVEVWGDSAYGQTSIPADARNVQAIAAGANHAVVLRADLVPAQVARLDQDNVLTGSLGIKRTPAINALEVEGNASKSTAGAWLANSDGRIKTEVKPVTGALETLDRVKLVDFRYTEAYRAQHPAVEDRRYLNVIAQEFAQVFPDHVKTSGERLPDGSAILQVDTYPLTIYAAAAVQELHKENATLKARLAEQEQRLRKLESALGAK